MKKKIANFILILTAAILLPHAIHAQVPASKQPRMNLSAEQLEDRFNQILAENLEADQVFLSFGAVRALDTIVKNAAKEFIKNNKVDDLPAADTGFKRFAAALIKHGRSSEIGLPTLNPGDDMSESKITNKTIDEVLNGKLNPLASDPQRIGGLCPLFPICK
ncbi:MAG TPA: hypothetical protein VGO56_22170 [Pyrinomonadaceae bacterium]|jgi:hypothetical protein|nr:hypothetical protein [Pyrinomonadaceae bacterium]